MPPGKYKPTKNTIADRQLKVPPQPAVVAPAEPITPETPGTDEKPAVVELPPIALTVKPAAPLKRNAFGFVIYPGGIGVKQ